MSKIVWVAMALVISLTSANTWANDWKFFQGVRISGIVQWQGNNQVLLQVGPDEFCHVAPDDKANIALVMTLYSSGRKADIHCFPTAEIVGGMRSYALHRIIAR